MCSSPLPMKLRSGEPAAEAEQQQRDLEQQADKQQQRRGKPREQPAAKPCCGGGSGKAARSSGGGGAAASQQLARSGKQDKDKRRHRGGTSLTAMTALGTVAVYAGVRGGIAAFHHARRHFLTRLLHDLAAALNALNATWWLDFGSLLGIYRDGELILHDNDVDVAVWRPDWPALLADLRAALPHYSMRIVVPSDDPEARFIRVYCPLGMADVFGAGPVGGADDAERLLVDCGHGSCTEIGRAAVLPTGVLTWRGSKLSVPGDVPAALEQRYGADWRVPRYMDKGADVVEGQKLYARIFRALGSLGIRI